jgi:hypothetical protein
MAQSLIGVSAPSGFGQGGNPILLLEQTVHWLRRIPAELWICHWAGSVPFALGLLFFCNSVTNPRTSGAAATAESLGMALLLAWMNSWRAIFAVRLRSLVSGSPDPAWDRARAVRLLSAQSFLGATKLIVLPLSALIMFPLAGVIAFYRYATVLESAEGFSKARKLAHIGHSQSWTLLLILQFLGLVVAVNVTLALALLPYGIRMLTGYESSFTRSGIFYVLNPLFGMVVIVVTWILFDPFVHAVYTLRCFHLESLETGEDLRAGLRRMRASHTLIAVACLLLLTAAGGCAQAAISPDQLEESIQQAVKAPAYDWRLPPKPAPAGKSGLVEVVDRMVAQFRWLSESIGNAIDRAIRWLLKQLGSRVPERLPGAPPSGLHGGIYLLIAVALAVAAIFTWRVWRRRPVTTQPVADGGAAPVPLDAEDLSPDRLPEEKWISLANQCLRDGNFRLALRALYLANLAWLGRQEYLTLHSGKTNREYETEIRRRGRAIPEAYGLFAANIAAFERAWYGTRAVSMDDVGEFRARVGRMKQLVAA